MKWGRKKPSLSSSSSRLSSISHVFPISWLSKFKQTSGNSEARPTKGKRQEKRNSPSVSTPIHGSCKNGRFYGGDDDAFWRLSFGEENVDGRKSRGGLKSVWYESDDDHEILPSSCRSGASKVAGRGETQKFSDMVPDMRRMRELSRNVENLPNFGTYRERGSEETEFKTPRREVVNDPKLRKMNRKMYEEKWLELGRRIDNAEESSPKTEERDMWELEPVRKIRATENDYSKFKASGSRKHRHVSHMNSTNSNLRTIEEECVFAALNLEETDRVSAEELSKKLKDMKIEELMSKGDKQRKSLYISREPPQKRRTKQSSKARANSPRTPSKVEVCKIKALEDMKKAKRKMKMAKEKTEEGRSALESFAVVKCSFDPQKDFKDSMVEMIMEKKIRRPEELEELLACYLTLNSDEYHDLIIKVFRQVWFDLNKSCFDPEVQNEHCFYD